MKYAMSVIINDPNTEKGMNSDLRKVMHAVFSHNPDTYGNGYYVRIVETTCYGGMFERNYDLRYDTDFNPKFAIAWLASWADTYWNGENEAYKLKSITIRQEGADDEEANK